jgi:hypothetical protein
MTERHEQSTDSLSRVQIYLLARGANRAYPSVLRPPSEDIVRLRQSRLRQRLLASADGLTEGAPR